MLLNVGFAQQKVFRTDSSSRMLATDLFTPIENSLKSVLFCKALNVTSMATLYHNLAKNIRNLLACLNLPRSRAMLHACYKGPFW